MSLPDGVTTCLLTYGPITDTFGNLADSITVTVKADRPIVHVATGRTMFDVPLTVTAGSGETVQIPVPHVDQPGFRDKQQNDLTMWKYTVELQARFPSGPQTDRKPFQPLVGQTTRDADLLPTDAMSLPAVVVTGTAVTSVNGQTGAVVIEAGGSDLTGTVPVSARIDIVTAGKAEIVSKETYLPATMTISGVPGVADYVGLIQIRGRGNYTWSLPKKPYKIKLPAKVSLMGMPAFDDWALLANHTDPSKINNALAFAIGKQADGLDWTPRSEFAQLYLNGDYAGLYQLTETVKRGSVRVNVDKAGTTGLALTGGYMLEGDVDYITQGTPGFTTSQGVSVIYDDPDGANSTQVAYIVGKVQEFEDALFDDGDWLDPTLGYAQFIDLDSFIDDYLISELASNQESSWHSSKKFYRTRDTAGVPGRFFMGPIWDYDISFGSVVNVAHPAVGYFARYPNAAGPGAIWINRMFGDPTFRAAVATRWTAMAARLADTTTGYAATIDALTTRVAAAALADQDRWSYAADWKSLADFKKAWLAERIGWMTASFAATVAPTLAPTSLAGTSGSDYITLTWSAVAYPASAPANDYVVQQLISGTWTTVATTPTLSATIDGLTAATAYDFRVAGRNDIGIGPNATVTVSTTALVTELEPDEVNGLALWLKADDLAGADGTAVALWEDAVGTRDLTQATAGNRPALRTAGSGRPNGHKIVEFDGLDDFLTNETDSSLPISTVFVVLRVDTRVPFMGAFTDTNGNDFMFTANEGANAEWLTGKVTNFERDGVATPAYSSDSTWHIYSATVGDGVYDGNVVANFSVGKDRNNADRFLDGAVAEIVTYNRKVTTSERAALTAGLKTKYAIA